MGNVILRSSFNFMSLLKLPGLIDAHVHLRDPGATHKEDFYTGSRAAVKGGFTFVLDMPNNQEPTITRSALEEKILLAEKKAICGIGFHFGTNGRNIDEFAYAAASPLVFGLKLYCNHTTGEMLIEDLGLLEQIFVAWQSTKPILVHAEGVQLAAAVALAQVYNRRLHVCHISQATEVELVRRAKACGQKVSAGVCPHHLFLTKESRDSLKGYAMMKPPLGTTEDQTALWAGLRDGTIDLVETDHAPHTKEEKEKDPPAYGVPGLETALSLLYQAAKEGKIKMADIEKFLYDNPKRIFNIPDQPDTYIEVDTEAEWIVGAGGYESKCGWSPFHGWKLPGQVITVVVGGKTVVAGGMVIT